MSARISRLARDQLNDQATLLAYVNHLENTVASLTGVPKVTPLSTPDWLHPEVDTEEKPEVSDSRQKSNPWKVEFKRWKEIRRERDVPVLVDDASATKESHHPNWSVSRTIAEPGRLET